MAVPRRYHSGRRHCASIAHEWLIEDLQSVRSSKDDSKRGNGSVKADVLKSMTQATLHVISATGFGIREPWTAYGHGQAISNNKCQSLRDEKHVEEKTMPSPSLLRSNSHLTRYSTVQCPCSGCSSALRTWACAHSVSIQPARNYEIYIHESKGTYGESG